MKAAFPSILFLAFAAPTLGLAATCVEIPASATEAETAILLNQCTIIDLLSETKAWDDIKFDPPANTAAVASSKTSEGSPYQQIVVFDGTNGGSNPYEEVLYDPAQAQEFFEKFLETCQGTCPAQDALTGLIETANNAPDEYKGLVDQIVDSVIYNNGALSLGLKIQDK